MTNTRAFKKLVFAEARRKHVKYGVALRQMTRLKDGNPAHPRTIAFVGMAGGIGRSALALAVASELCGRGVKTLYVEVVERSKKLNYGQFRGLMSSYIARRTPAGARRPHVAEMDDLEIVAGKLSRVAQGFEVVLLDAARHVDMQYAAMMCADVAVVPAGSNVKNSLVTLIELAALVRQKRQVSERFLRAAVVSRRAWRTEPAIRAVLEAAAVPAFATVLSDTDAYSRPVANGFSLKGSRLRVVRREMKPFVDELLAEQGSTLGPYFPRKGFAPLDATEGVVDATSACRYDLWSIYADAWDAARTGFRRSRST